MISKVTIIGTGNIATWFASVLFKNHIGIFQIYDRNIEKAAFLSEKYSAQPISDLNLLSSEADLYIFSIKDDCLVSVVDKIPFQLPFAVHTAGSLSQFVFKNHASRFGVIYPYQSINKRLNFDNMVVPLAVEGDNPDTCELLYQFAGRLSEIVYKIDEKQREALHVAAIFGNNFANALYDISYHILQEHHIDWKIILPLLEETVLKVKAISPSDAQTGPAKRQDFMTVEKHINYLENKEIQNIYRILTQYIISQQKK